MKKNITTAQRKHQDYLRRKGLAVGQVYAKRLVKLRQAEVKRCLELCKNYDDTLQWSRVIENSLSESGYLFDWYSGLYLNAGLPQAESVIRDLSRSKASTPGGVYEATLRNFATQRCGQNIASVSGTLRTDLTKILANALNEDANIGIEKLTKRIQRDFNALNVWQARRIAQTETMIGLAEASAVAAADCDVEFTKQWCISGVGNSRDAHEAVDGVIVDQDEYFLLTNSDGTTCEMLFPHDNGSSIPAEQIINCACSCIRSPKKASASKKPTVTPAVQPQPEVQPVTIVPASTQPKPKIPAKPKPTPAPAPAAPASSAFSAAEEQRIAAMIQEMPDTVPAEARRAIAENNLALEKELKVTKGAPMSVDDADKSHGNPNYLKSRSYRINCATCSPTYLMRIRGFDVTAGPCVKKADNLLYYLSRGHSWEKWQNADGTAAKHLSLSDWAKQKNLTKLTADDYLKFYEEHTKSTGIYEVSVAWSSKGGHSTLLQRFADGTLYRIDAQSGTKALLTAADDICTAAEKKVTALWSGRGIMRIDDKVLNTRFAKIFRKVKK